MTDQPRNVIGAPARQNTYLTTHTDRTNQVTDHNHPDLEATMDRLAEAMTDLADDMRTLARLHAEHSADINRLYAAWPEHLREGHTS